MGRVQTEFDQQTGKAVREVGQGRAREKEERGRGDGELGTKRRTRRASSQNAELYRNEKPGEGREAQL